jgi:hypothetical protein
VFDGCPSIFSCPFSYKQDLLEIAVLVGFIVWDLKVWCVNRANIYEGSESTSLVNDTIFFRFPLRMPKYVLFFCQQSYAAQLYACNRLLAPSDIPSTTDNY